MSSYINIPASTTGLSPIANNTVLGNTSGGSATPTAQNQAALIAAGIIQDPSNVAITGGSITGVNAATRSTQGAMSAADKAFLDDFEGWQKTQYATMIAAVSSLTRFDAFKCGNFTPAFTATTSAVAMLDGNVEGGGVTGNGGVVILGPSIFQNMPAGGYAFAFRAKIASVAAGGNVGYCGVFWNVSTHTARAWLGVNNAANSTNFLLDFQTDSAATQVVLGTFDTNWHDWVFTDDGTTVKGFKDGTLAGSTATRTNIPVANPMSPGFYSSATNEIIVSRFAYGYVQP